MKLALSYVVLILLGCVAANSLLFKDQKGDTIMFYTAVIAMNLVMMTPEIIRWMGEQRCSGLIQNSLAIVPSQHYEEMVPVAVFFLRCLVLSFAMCPGRISKKEFSLMSLPVDILTEIIGFIDYDDCFQLLTVSKIIYLCSKAQMVIVEEAMRKTIEEMAEKNKEMAKKNKELTAKVKQQNRQLRQIHPKQVEGFEYVRNVFSSFFIVVGLCCTVAGFWFLVINGVLIIQAG